MISIKTHDGVTEYFKTTEEAIDFLKVYSDELINNKINFNALLVRIKDWIDVEEAKKNKNS